MKKRKTDSRMKNRVSRCIYLYPSDEVEANYHLLTLHRTHLDSFVILSGHAITRVTANTMLEPPAKRGQGKSSDTLKVGYALWQRAIGSLGVDTKHESEHHQARIRTGGRYFQKNCRQVGQILKRTVGLPVTRILRVRQSPPLNPHAAVTAQRAELSTSESTKSNRRHACRPQQHAI